MWGGEQRCLLLSVCVAKYEYNEREKREERARKPLTQCSRPYRHKFQETTVPCSSIGLFVLRWSRSRECKTCIYGSTIALLKARNGRRQWQTRKHSLWQLACSNKNQKSKIKSKNALSWTYRTTPPHPLSPSSRSSSLHSTTAVVYYLQEEVAMGVCADSFCSGYEGYSYTCLGQYMYCAYDRKAELPLQLQQLCHLLLGVMF